jgi:peptide/nickel transport system permease protein
MTRFLLSRLLQVIPTLFGITVISFLLMQLAPGGPVDQLTDLNPHVTAEAKERIRKELGLDQPITVQYARWFKRAVTLDFGNSFNDKRPVIEKIADRLPATILLNVLSIGAILLLAIPLGFLSAVYARSWFDKLVTVAVFIGFSIPTYALALLLMIVFGLKLGWLPVSGISSLFLEREGVFWRALDVVKHLLLPTFVLAITGLASLTRYMRNNLLEVIHQDFVRAAEAKGLGFWRVYGVHAGRNSLISLLTLFGLMLPELIGGGFVIETIFAYPGIGRLGYEAIMMRDYNLIMAITVITGFLTVLGNLLADVLYAVADPRIRY